MTTSFEEVCPLLEKMQSKSYALTMSRWLAEQLHRPQDKISAFKTALALAVQCRQAATTKVRVHVCMYVCMYSGPSLIRPPVIQFP